MTASFTPHKTPCSLPERRPSGDTSARSQRDGGCGDAGIVFVAQLDTTNCVYAAFKGGWGGLCWLKLIAQITGLPRRGGRPTGLPFSLVSLHYLFAVATFAAAATQHASDWLASSNRPFFYFFPWKFARPLQECPGLGRLQRGGCWELGCVLDQGLNFPSEDEEKGLWHAPMRVSPAL